MIFLENILEVQSQRPNVDLPRQNSYGQSIESISLRFYNNLLRFVSPEVAGLTKQFFIEHINDPNKSQRVINDHLLAYDLSCLVVGSLLNRSIIIIDGKYRKNNAIFITTAPSLVHLNTHITSLYGKLNFYIESISTPYSKGTVSSFFIENFEQLKFSLIGLYRTEIFPVPRVALGISCIARALRDDYLSQVFLHDMQLGGHVTDYVDKILNEEPQIIGVSVTFGQQEILEQFLDGIKAKVSSNYEPLIVVGGSLAAFNKDIILKMYPNVVVAVSYGEVTIPFLVRYKLGILPIADVPGIAYSENGIAKETKSVKNNEQEIIIPELDLLIPTLSKNGVMQLESSRGCTFSCSFCPRDHKGLWFGNDPLYLEKLMPFIAESYVSRENSPKKIFLVDEEFIGYTKLSPQRAMRVSDTLKKYGFQFETSARADQVFSTKHSKEWHIDRISFWKNLKSSALSRCLFGIESGVDSVLLRFNKKTTSKQNTYAIRLLSCSGIPTRFTYITFDNLMSINELIESYKFLGRKDLLLKNCGTLDSSTIYSIATDDTLALDNSSGNPFYYEVSYMLVKMENLVNSKYAKMVIDRELVQSINKSMGTINADYIDPVIGEFADMSQRWIDRNFAFDYLLKGIQKISAYQAREAINTIRLILKRYSYELLGQFIYMYTGRYELLAETASNSQRQRIKLYHKESTFCEVESYKIREVCFKIMDAHMSELQISISEIINDIFSRIPEIHHHALDMALSQWHSRSGWNLING